MPENKQQDDDHMSAPSPSIVRLLILTLADTTWRLFVPSVGGTVLGVWADNSFDTKPWLTIIGVSLGTILSFTLVYLQIKKVGS